MFSVNDEIVCVDDSELNGYAVLFKKGDVFTVAAVWPKGVEFGPFVTSKDCVSIGIPEPMLNSPTMPLRSLLPSVDLWPANRFRKVQKKRSREELYSLIGIDGMVDQREGVAA